LGNPAVTLTGSYAEPLTLLLMLAVFALLAIRMRWPIGIALASAGVAGAVCNGYLFPLRHLVEGGLSYLDPILVIATAMIFMRLLADGDALVALGNVVERRFGNRPLLLLPLLMLIVLFPGMITGSSTASILTTGAVASSILLKLGLSMERAAAYIAMGGILGMVAPPVNIPAMLIGGGIDLPYSGFDRPLALAAFPLALVLAYGIGWPLIRCRNSANRNFHKQIAGTRLRNNAGAATMDASGADASRTLPVILSPDPMDRGELREDLSDETSISADRSSPIPEPVPPAAGPKALLWQALCGPAVAAILMIGPRLAPRQVPDLGLPLVFLLAAAASILVLPKFGVFSSMLRAIDETLPVLGILAGVGAFIQIMTLTGARGWLVSVMLDSPAWALLAAATLSIPLFGAVSAFGSASVLGVPFLLALLGRNEVVTTSALSLLTALGDLMLPAALAATLAAQVTGAGSRYRVLRLCLLPALITAAVAVMMLIYSQEIGRWLK
jgi:gluconate:H+ symporter, GntP family